MQIIQPDPYQNSVSHKYVILFRFIPLIFFMTVIFFLSHTPGNNFPSIFRGMDKLAHMSAYAILALTFLFAITPFFKNTSFLPSAILTVLFCLAHGLTDEFHQSFIPGRSPDINDIIADGVGALLAVFLWKIWSRRKR